MLADRTGLSVANASQHLQHLAAQPHRLLHFEQAHDVAVVAIADLAMAANFFVRDDAEETAYLDAYFGEPAGDYRRARFFLARHVQHLAYAAFLLPIAAKMGAAITPDLDAPDFQDFHRRLVTNEIEMKTAEERVQYAKVHLNAARSNLASPRFAESLAVVSRTHAG